MTEPNDKTRRPDDTTQLSPLPRARTRNTPPHAHHTLQRSISIPDAGTVFYLPCGDPEPDRDIITANVTSPVYDIEKASVHRSVKHAVISNEAEVARGDGASSYSTSDPNLIEWQGEDDPEMPRNWKRARKWLAVFIVSAFTFMSPVTSSIMAPSLQQIGEELNISSASEESLCLSVFVLGFAFGPLVTAPLSELYGRAIVFQISNIFYLIFNLACGFAKTKDQLIIFRLFAGLGGSVPLALGPGVLADLFSDDERGIAASMYSLFPLLGPAIGPICGGFITQYSSWRWAFWGTTIADFPVLILGTIFLEETYPPTLLQRKVRKLSTETGNLNLYTRYNMPDRSIKQEVSDAMIRPIKLMTTQIIVQVMGLYQAYIYGLMYIVLTTFPSLWRDRYHESVGIAGLNYISLGIGFVGGIQISGRLQDKVYCILKRRNNGVGLPEFRAPMMIPVAVLLPVGLFMYGWTAQYTTHWILPNIGAVMFSAGIMIGFNALMSYVVDSYTIYSASANAATSLLRSLAAFLFPLWAPSMYKALDYGWGNSVLAFVAIAIGVPAPILLWKYGAWLRARSTYAAG